MIYYQGNITRNFQQTVVPVTGADIIWHEFRQSGTREPVLPISACGPVVEKNNRTHHLVFRTAWRES